MEAHTQLKMQHSSLQFSDSSAKQKKDISDLFEKGQQYPIKTGTEAGPEEGNANRQWLIEYAKEYRHFLHFGRSSWIAVSRAIVKPGTFERGQVFIADNDETWGRGHDTVLATVEFDHMDPRIGHIAQGAIHYPLRGAQPGDVNHRINVRTSRMCGRWMQRAGAGSALAFLNGDFNMNDVRVDWDFNVGKFTSMADELGDHQNTGHGPIDGFCSFDGDRRVSAKSFDVLDDSEFFQFGDHYVCRGVWNVRLRKHA